MKSFIDKYFYFFLAIAIAINVPGLLLGVLDQDSALYASIAKTIVTKNDWLNLYSYGTDWLDKPHFPFWMEAFSMKLFGINAFAYKLPSFIFWLIGSWYTYKLAVLIYNKNVAQLSVIIYMTALHILLANFDVRAEGFLTALTIAAIYHLICWNNQFSYKHFILAALTTAMAVMTKGIFITISIGGGLVWYCIWTNQYKRLLTIKNIFFILLVIILCFPELYSLYYQFDLHPEKVVFNKTGVSGIRFFLWDSQFGRFFNSGPIKGEGDISFYLHTTIWAFLPWSFILIPAIWQQFSKRAEYRSPSLMKYITGSALISFLLFSFSKFQLPHYIVILFPHFAIISATYLLSNLKENIYLKLSSIQLVVFTLVYVLIIVLLYYAHIPYSFLLIGIISIIYILFMWIIIRNYQYSILLVGLGIASILSIFLFGGFYPFLFQYQAGMQAGRTISTKYQGLPVMEWNIENSGLLRFYTTSSIAILKNDKELNHSLVQNSTLLLFTKPQEADSLKAKGYHIQQLEQFDLFRVTMLNTEFLNPATRSNTLQKRCLLLVSR